ncbi:protein-ER retention protein [Ceratocystis pirilliformis]|uniref:Protein-ER retention protein n=1 Tax=Ceratocystis pirilliformis TaxID=259994 RepID=A0ABR3YIT2_9PEZI
MADDLSREIEAEAAALETAAFGWINIVLPLPYRIGLIVVLGAWAWGANLHYLSLLNIDVPRLIHYPPRPSRSLSTDLPHHASTYRFATALSIMTFMSLLLFWAVSRGDPERVLIADWIAVSYLGLLAAAFVIPVPRGSRLANSGRRRFLQMLRRVAVGGLAQPQHGKFGDVLLADVLTSYAKVLADVWVCACMFGAWPSATAVPNRACGGEWFGPIVLALPSCIRLRQCLIEYVRVRNGPRREATGWGGQHLANAAKYASAFPVIFFSSLQKAEPSYWHYKLWAMAALLNSLYSFWWDVTKDWDLTLLDDDRRVSKEYPWGLRSRRFFQPVGVYYVVIVLDLVLRLTWSVKLSPHLSHVSDYEVTIYALQLAEVLRRFAWIFVRVETEWIRMLDSPDLGARELPIKRDDDN